MKALNDAYRKEKDPEKSTEIKDKMEPFYEEMGKITDRFIVSTGGIWALLLIFLIPGALLIYGFIRWLRRQKL